MSELTLNYPMARPLSEEKRTALLTAATRAVAASGVAAATSKIAKDAGVAEGTLFVYFPTKDDLLNQLFLELKSDLMRFIAAGFPFTATIDKQLHHLFMRFIDWGVIHAEKRSALRQLSVSEKITEMSQSEAEAMYYDFQSVMEEGFKTGVLREQPLSFLGGVIQSLADMVLHMAAQDLARLEQYKTLGWAALWGAIGRR